MAAVSFTPLLLVVLIGSSWCFGSLMKTVGNGRSWNPKSTFWIGASLYGVAGYIIPMLLLEIAYSDYYFYWIFVFTSAAPIYLIVNAVLKRQEQQKPQSSVAQDKQPYSLPTNHANKNQMAKRPAETIPATSSPPEGSVEAASKVGFVHVFVSYRRSDSADIAGRIYDRLVGRFGREPVFKDVDSIPLGLDFKEYLDKKVGECDVLLAIIGDRWLDASNKAGKSRLEDPTDFVRIEIESALGRGIPVIPLLVRGAEMPHEESLPSTLRKLVYRNGIPIRSDPDFHRDMDRLISALEKYAR